VKKGRMLYTDVMPEVKLKPVPIRRVRFRGVDNGRGRRLDFWNLLSTGYWAPKFLPAWMIVAPYDKPVAEL